MLRRTFIAVALCATLAGVGAASAGGQGGEQIAQSWAKLNACSPTQLGARAQLAGDGSRSAMSVRFTAQWLSPDGWVPVAGAASSPVLPAGTAQYTWGQAGWNFDISLPPGFAYELRAVADLEWSTGEAQTLVTGTCSVGG